MTDQVEYEKPAIESRTTVTAELSPEWWEEVFGGNVGS